MIVFDLDIEISLCIWLLDAILKRNGSIGIIRPLLPLNLVFSANIVVSIGNLYLEGVLNSSGDVFITMPSNRLYDLRH